MAMRERKMFWPDELWEMVQAAARSDEVSAAEWVRAAVSDRFSASQGDLTSDISPVGGVVSPSEVREKAPVVGDLTSDGVGQRIADAHTVDETIAAVGTDMSVTDTGRKGTDFSGDAPEHRLGKANLVQRAGIWICDDCGRAFPGKTRTQLVGAVCE